MQGIIPGGNMSFRKDVFQAKVLQRLYPAAPQVEKVLDSTSVHIPDPAPVSKRVQLKPNIGTGSVAACGLLGKKVYTVLPPPEEYRPTQGDEKSEAISIADGTAGPEHSDDSEEEDEGAHTRKRRKRKKKSRANDARAWKTSTSTQDGTVQGQEEEAVDKNRPNLQVPGVQGRLSKSKKRKLKKKRQKEKLHSLGLAPQSRALEFTYRLDRGEEEEENDEGKSQNTEEVLDFLRTTWDLYCSDHSRTVGSPFLSLSTAESLFTHLSEGKADVSSVCRLRALLGHREVEQLNTALQEFRHNSTMSTDETQLICSLFYYWITEVLPMQTEEKS
ncbi:glutamate-rich protein 1 [Hoplias malabaricus]|uniref:glutamate-rich protein 1 n=1 Tax=Hoplias malabaricus TaxID=27720 RepID=UPI00346190CF